MIKDKSGNELSVNTYLDIRCKPGYVAKHQMIDHIGNTMFWCDWQKKINRELKQRDRFCMDNMLDYNQYIFEFTY